MTEHALARAEPWSQRRFVLGVAAVCLLLLLTAWAHALTRPDLPAAYGPDLVVLEVKPRGPGNLAGLRAGDRVLSVAGLAVSSQGDLQRALSRWRPGQVVPCTVQRGEGVLTLAVPLARASPAASLWLAWGTGLLYGLVGTWIALRHTGNEGARIFWFLGMAVMLVLGAGGSRWPPATVAHIVASGAVGGLVLHLAAVFPEERPWLRERAAWFYAPGALGTVWNLLVYRQSFPLRGAFLLSGHHLSTWVLLAWDLLCGVVASLLLVQRYRNIRRPVLRRRVEWVVWSGAVALVGIAVYVGSALFQGPEELHATIAVLACAVVPLSLTAAFGQDVLSLEELLRRVAIYSLVTLVLLSL